MSKELRSMIDHVSGIVVDEFDMPSLLDAWKKGFVIVVKEIMILSNGGWHMSCHLLELTW